MPSSGEFLRIKKRVMRTEMSPTSRRALRKLIHGGNTVDAKVGEDVETVILFNRGLRDIDESFSYGQAVVRLDWSSSATHSWDRIGLNPCVCCLSVPQKPQEI